MPLSILINNVLDGATFDANPAPAALLGVNNLKDPLRSHVFRSTGTSQQFNATFPQASVKDVVLCQHNITAGAVVQVELRNGASILAQATVSYKGDNAIKHSFSQAYGCNTVAWSVYDPTNPDSYLQIGRAGAGVLWSPQYGMQPGTPRQTVSVAQKRRSRAGSLYVSPGPEYERIPMQLVLTLDEAQALRSAPSDIDLFVSLYHGWHNASLENDSEGMFFLMEKPSIPHDSPGVFRASIMWEGA